MTMTYSKRRKKNKKISWRKNKKSIQGTSPNPWKNAKNK